MCGTAGMPWSTAELTWALILALAKKVTVEDAAIRQGRFMTSLGVDLHGKTLGCVSISVSGSVSLCLSLSVRHWCVCRTFLSPSHFPMQN